MIYCFIFGAAEVSRLEEDLGKCGVEMEKDRLEIESLRSLLGEAFTVIEADILCDWRRRGFRYEHNDNCRKCALLARLRSGKDGGKG